MKKSMFLLMAALYSVCSFSAKYVPATLIKIDGEKIECLLQDFKVDAKKLKYKETQNAKPVTIQSAELTRVLIHYDEGDAVVDYLKYIDYSSFVRGKDKVAKKPMWMQRVVSGPCSLYTYTIVTKQNGATFIEHWYACRKQNEDVPRIVGSESGGAAVITLFDPFPKALSKYFSDYPELAEKIRTKKYTGKNMMEIVKEYNLEKSVK